MKITFFLTCICLFASFQFSSASPLETLTELQKEKDLALYWAFNNSANPQSFNGWNAQLSSGKPRFAPGLQEQGVLIEEDSRNLLPPGAAACTDVAAFEALPGTSLKVEKANGHSVLHVQTDDKATRQGVQVKTTFPDNETSTWAVASLQIGGSGRVAIQLLDLTNYTVGAPLYLELTGEMQRVSPPPIEVIVPGGELQLRVSNADRAPTDFRIAALQIEPLQVATSWLPGKEARPRETLEYTIGHDTSKLDEGTVFFWVKPNWNPRIDVTLMREGKREPRTFFSLRNGTSGVVLFWIIYNALGNGAKFVGAQDIYNNDWHFFALSWKGKTGLIYADGKSIATTVTPISPRAKFVFGPYANAVLDEAALLTTALTKEELDKLFVAAKTAKP